MPRQNTKEEIMFKSWLDVLEIPYSYQHQFSYLGDNGKIRYFYVDFLININNINLVVFIDGGEHIRSRQKAKDIFQEIFLTNEFGLTCLRITNYRINTCSPSKIIREIRVFAKKMAVNNPVQNPVNNYLIECGKWKHMKKLTD